VIIFLYFVLLIQSIIEISVLVFAEPVGQLININQLHSENLSFIVFVTFISSRVKGVLLIFLIEKYAPNSQLSRS